jgi:SAM-dependent methyltransferase
VPPDKIHEEIGRAWDIVAETKYKREIGEHVRFLKAGHHGLLPPEVEALSPHLANADVVHLQCSHGLDTLALLNLGAASVTGVDISPAMIRQARETAEALGKPANFVCSDILSIPAELNGSADLVYTGKGALPWLMDLAPWAKVVARLLRPGGRVYVFEGHPLDWLWERDVDTLQLRPDVGYFDQEPRENPGFPAQVVERAVGPQRPRMFERQWRPDEVIGSLIAEGLRLELFHEHPLLYWEQFPRWRPELVSRLPHSYSVMAVRDDAARA